VISPCSHLEVRWASQSAASGGVLVEPVAEEARRTSLDGVRSPDTRKESCRLYARCIVQVSNHEIFYRAVTFYLDENPMQVNALLNTISAKA
jgi:hypothetical protein